MSLWRDLDSLTRNLLKIASQYIATGDSYHNSLNFCCDELNIPSWDGNICKTAAAAIVNKSHSVLFRISSGKWFGGRATLCLHKFLPKEELGRKFWSSSLFPKLWKWKWRYCQIKDRNKRQITGLITTRRIATKILEFIAITQKLWKWKWRYHPKKMKTRNKSQDWSPQEEVFSLIIFPVLSCCYKGWTFMATAQLAKTENINNFYNVLTLLWATIARRCVSIRVITLFSLLGWGS